MPTGASSTSSGYQLQIAQTLLGFAMDRASDNRSVRQAKAQAKLNNALAARNFQLINEEQMASMVAHNLDSFEIYKATRAKKAAALAARGGGSLSSASLQASMNNIQRQGSLSQSRKNYNLGAKMRNLDIERGNVTISAHSLNNQAFNRITQKSNIIGTGLNLLTIGSKASRDPQFKSLNVETGVTS